MLILDSDDKLTEDAIETILTDWPNYQKNQKIAGLSYNRKLINLEETGGKLKVSPYISNHIACRYNEGYYADRVEVYRVDVMRKFPFPVFEGERFLSEAIVWNQIAYEYDTVYIDKYIYICEYQLDGLTQSSQKTRIKSPIGSMENYRIMMKKPFRTKLRVKYAILYNTFANFAHVSFSNRLKDTSRFLVVITKPLGDFVYRKWRKKYLG